MLQPKYLFIDLSKQETKPYEISEEYIKTYIGGKALAARILYDETEAGVDALGEDNILIINTGVLLGTGAPSSSRFNVTTKSPITGGIATSNCGGNFGIKLRKSGYDGLIIKGKADKPTYIEITDGELTFHSAEELWGMDTEETQEALPKKHGKVVIGPAGENLVLYACIVSQERVAGRAGVGTVMGSKNLKAIISNGKRKIPVEHPKKFKKFIKKWIKKIRKNIMTSERMPKYGTMGFATQTIKTGIMPVKNFGEDSFEGSEKVTGKYFTDHYLTKNYGCVSCPIQCGRRTKLGDKDIKGPEYETSALLGPNLLNDDFNKIIKWNYLADLMGLDTISLAGTLAFSMELKEKGLADFGLNFGDFDNIDSIIEDIANRRGKCDELANGTKWLSEKYGGKDFAIHSKGLDLAAYNPKTATGLGLGYSTSNRGGCHLNGGYLVLLEGLMSLKLRYKAKRTKTAFTVFMQNTMDAISTAGICLFTSFTIFPSVVYKSSDRNIIMKILSFFMSFSAPIIGFMDKHPGLMFFNMPFMPYPKAIYYATGIKMNIGKFLKLGETCFNIERMFNVREGISSKDDTLSKRLTDKSEAKNVPLDKMLPLYYKYRVWDENGVPKEKKLKKLGIKI
jgi:aldehyde:ferredoxin oxidoreductase